MRIKLKNRKKLWTLFDGEVCFLVAHSMFHLLGYDHMTEEDEKTTGQEAGKCVTMSFHIKIEDDEHETI